MILSEMAGELRRMNWSIDRPGLALARWYEVALVAFELQVCWCSFLMDSIWGL